MRYSDYQENLTGGTLNVTVASITITGLTADRAVATDGTKKLVTVATTRTELGYLSGVTSAIQTQINTKAPTASPTFTGTVTTPLLILSSSSANKLQYLNGSKQFADLTIGSSLDFSSPPTLNTIQDIRTSATPTFAGGTFTGGVTGTTLTLSGAGQGTVWTSTTDYPGSPNVGDLGYDADTKATRGCTPAGDGALWKSLYGNTAPSSAIASTAAETDFSLTFTFPAASLAVGSRIQIRASGVFATTGTPTLNIRQYFGTNTAGVSGDKTCDNNEAAGIWIIELQGIIRSSTSAYFQGWIWITGTSTAYSIPISAAVVIDTTGAIVVKISADWSASSSSNTTTLQTLFVGMA